MEVDVPKTILLIVHITAAALWIGPPLGVLPNVTRSLAAGREALGVAIKDFNFRGLLSGIGGAGVLVTGVIMMFYSFGGFKTSPWPFHAALGLVVLAMINSAAFGKGMKTLRAAHESFNDTTVTAARNAVKKMKPFSHINNALWLGALVMMIIAKYINRA